MLGLARRSPRWRSRACRPRNCWKAPACRRRSSTMRRRACRTARRSPSCAMCAASRACPRWGCVRGARQRLSDFGVYGYALAEQRHLRRGGATGHPACAPGRAGAGKALAPGRRHCRLRRPRRDGAGRGAAAGHRVLVQLDPQAGRVHPRGADGHAPFAAALHAAELWRCLRGGLRLPGALRRRGDGAALRRQQLRAALSQRQPHHRRPVRQVLRGPAGGHARRSRALSRTIRVACLDSRGSFPTAEAMARQLGHSVRTLHRRLADEGTNYQEIVDQVRRSLALEFLQNTSLTVEEIAERVGFSEASNFRKAFKRWTGRRRGTFAAAPEGGTGRLGRAHADGVLPSANVPRPSGSSFISLRGAHHRREPDAQRDRGFGPHNTARPVPRAPGVPRSEIKEEPKAGDIRGGGHPVSSHAPPDGVPLNNRRSAAAGTPRPNRSAKVGAMPLGRLQMCRPFRWASSRWWR